MSRIPHVKGVNRDPLTGRKLQHFGPEPRYGVGPEMVHHIVHEHAIGKTIAAVYLGDSERFKSLDPENSPPDGIFRGEYLAFEFSDGSSLVLETAAGNSFHVAIGRTGEKVLKTAKAAAVRRARKPQ